MYSSSSRSASFHAGMSGTGDKASSLEAESAGFNAKVQATASNPNALSMTPNSVLMPYMKSANGNSAADARRQTPSGQLPTMNGSAQSTYNIQNPQFGYRLSI